MSVTTVKDCGCEQIDGGNFNKSQVNLSKFMEVKSDPLD